MKKNVFLMCLLLAMSIIGWSQSYVLLNVEEIPDEANPEICANSDIDIIIYGETNCENKLWYINNIPYASLDSIIIENPHEVANFRIEYIGCEIPGVSFTISFVLPPNNPFDEPIIWKKIGEIITLQTNDGHIMDPLWSTGEIGQIINVTEPGTYSVTLTHDCGTVTYSVEVRDNVELYRATCDLLTNRNKVTWLTTPEQAEYVSAVKVYRNNVLVATVPYTDGSFTDDIGSDATQWQYHLVAVSVEGDDCPIPSYWKRTIHLDRIQDSQGNLILQWTPYEEEEPDKETVSAYGIYDIVGGEAHHVVDVGYFTNVYTYNPADFSGYGAVAAVFNNSKGLEDLAFSNRTIEMLLVDENLTGKMVVYPNPTNGEFTVEGVKDLTVFNTLGQTIATSHSENGTHRITVSSGIYFIKSDEGMVRKVVVE